MPPFRNARGLLLIKKLNYMGDKLKDKDELVSWDSIVKDAIGMHEIERRKKFEEWLKIGDTLSYDVNQDVGEQKFILHLNIEGEMWRLASPGGIGVIAGPPKARKTALISAIEAAGISRKQVLGVDLDLEGGKIMAFDTEQGIHSFSNVKRRVYNWAGLTSNTERYKAYTLRTLYPQQKLEFIQAHVFSGEKPKMVVIDVVTDILYGANDHDKSQLLVEEILKLAGKDTLTILSIHLTKEGKIYGHIGSALAKKVDFAIRIERDEEDKSKSVVTCDFVRDGPDFPKFYLQQEGKSLSSRIFRPDLEKGGWENVNNSSKLIMPQHMNPSTDNSNGMAFQPNVNITQPSNIDDEIPF